MYLLDTVVLSELRKTQRNEGVTAWISDRKDAELFISVVSIGEIVRGIDRQTKVDIEFANTLQRWLDNLLLIYNDRILPVDIRTAKQWGILSNRIGNSGADILMAATALEHNLSVVTRNERHFADTGIRIINLWT
ncbi:MAG: type II toxin-antitoxin system VapC family toxin [Desulfovibrio sp.]|jgi:predicted nucleic acid-binding protein|nr:type II toxin-antitoxin system VapC family toxin [Desulfovibrio sp.]